MKISKIDVNEKTNKAANNVDFKAIKLKRSSLKMANPLEKDIVELKNKLPDNKAAKDKKYFGGYDPYNGGSDKGGSDVSTADVVTAGAAVAIGLALALL